MTGQTALVLQHIACEPPGVYEDVLRERGMEILRVELDEGEPLPELDGIGAIVAMGGPMSVVDEALHPWLADEKRLIAEAVEAEIPFFGTCLGVQLLAASLGATVSAGETPEVGILPVYGTEAALQDPVFAGLRWPRPTLQWHGDTFALPEGATLLATSPAYPHQAFRVGKRAYGVQFHLEVTDEMAGEWARVPAYAASAERALGPGGLDRLLADFRAHASQMRADARVLFSRWVDLWAPAMLPSLSARG
jgi:GMP synthase (glutamine-hydrolysing)